MDMPATLVASVLLPSARLHRKLGDSWSSVQSSVFLFKGSGTGTIYRTSTGITLHLENKRRKDNSLIHHHHHAKSSCSK